MNRPALVTGAAGFAGSHLLDLLRRDGPVVAWHRPGGRGPAGGPWPDVRWEAVDLLDPALVRHAVERARPSAVYHCAGVPHVGASWERALDTLETNVLGTHHLLEALRISRIDARILVPGSALVYRPSTAALTEEAPIGPSSPYGLSKLAQEMLGARAAADEGMHVLIARPFNHVGPRQAPAFAASSFARQIATIETGGAEPVVRVGNLDARRDLTDVRDTVRAYRTLVVRGRPGRPYNVCSGRAYTLGEILERLVACARTPVEVHVDPARLRPVDISTVLGDPGRIEAETGWRPEISLDRTLGDLLDYWRTALSGRGS